MTLGETVEISLSVQSIADNRTFLEQLGFKCVGENPDPANRAAVLTDGVIHIGLYERAFPTPTITYYAPDMPARITNLRDAGITIGDDNTLADPNGQRIHLFHFSEKMTPPTGTSTARMGTFGEFTIPTSDVKKSAAFWQKYGFTQTSGHDSDPYPYAVMNDGLLTIGLHQTDTIPRQHITYFAPDMIDRIAALLADGIEAAWQETNAQGQINRVSLRAPGGQLFYLFEE